MSGPEATAAPAAFSSEFDALMARAGPPAIFTRTFDGEWRLSADLTRDRYTHGEPPPREPGFVLFRDRATGFVSLFYVTGLGLVRDHPRADVRAYPDEASALAALAALGRPPMAEAL